MKRYSRTMDGINEKQNRKPEKTVKTGISEA
jgi:hypothetical protein